VLLDVEDLIPGAEYTLEASSPGLDRKLVRRRFLRLPATWLRFRRLSRSATTATGRAGLTGEADKTITLDLNAVKQNSKSRKTGVCTVEIALDNIEKAGNWYRKSKKQGPETRDYYPSNC